MGQDEVLESISGEVDEFQNLGELLATEPAAQVAFGIMIFGLIGIFTGYRKLNSWVRTKKFSYSRPHVSRFVRRAILPIFALALISSTNAYITATGLFANVSEEEFEEGKGVRAVFAKFLDSINIIIIGWTVAHLIPIALVKRDKAKEEREDFDDWFENRGFVDDEKGFFHKCYKWVPPKTIPEDLTEEEFQQMLKTKEGLEQLENFRTTKGNPLGGYEKLVDDPFEEWKKSERAKYDKYYHNCVTGHNQSGRKLKPGVKPEEIFPIDVWREEKRIHAFEPIIPSSRPPGYARKKREGVPKSVNRLIELAIIVGSFLFVLHLWGFDLFVLATATGGLALGIGLALRETMENYFAYILIRKDKIVAEGDRVQLDTGFNGYVHKITPRVTYVRQALHESLAIIPTKTLISAQIINYTKENKLVPAIVEVGVSYLNNPKQVAAILVKVGKRIMKETKDSKGRHLVRQNRCPYLDHNEPSCGCDKELHIDIQQPTVRFNKFNDSSLDFSMWLYVRDYGSQFKTKTDMRMAIHEEFKKNDIRIPWPIRTVYQGDEKKEAEEIGQLDDQRDQVIDEYGIGDITKGEGEGGGGD